MGRKAQVSVFLIIGIVVVVALVLFFALRLNNVSSAGSQKMSLQSKSIDIFIQSCLQAKGEEAVYILGLQGGHIVVPPINVLADNGTVGYGFYNRTDVLPTKVEMETDLKFYVEKTLDECYANFSEFTVQGMVINASAPKVEVVIATSEVKFNLISNITVQNAQIKNKIGPLSSSVQIPLGRAYAEANDIVAKQVENPYWIDFNYLSSIPDRVDILPQNSTDYLISITCNDTIPEPFVFEFGNTLILNKAPELLVADELTFFKEVPVNMKISAVDSEGQSFKLYADGSLFSMTSDGNINFTPHIPGDYYVKFTAEDELAAKSSKVVQITVLPSVSKPELVISDMYAKAGQEFKTQIYVKDASMPLAFRSLPDWFKIDPATGAVDFIPPQAGDFRITISVTNGASIDTQTVLLHVS